MGSFAGATSPRASGQQNNEQQQCHYLLLFILSLTVSTPTLFPSNLTNRDHTADDMSPPHPQMTNQHPQTPTHMNEAHFSHPLPTDY